MAHGGREVLILGAGAMGAGIAQVAATHGWIVHLRDVDESTVRRAIDEIKPRLNRLVEKGKMTEQDRDQAAANLQACRTLDELSNCELVIEAIVENHDAKVKALLPIIEAVKHDVIITSNTSSLSITKLGKALAIGPRFVGMHFFNPAPLLQLVEVIAGDETSSEVVERVSAIATSWGKKVARAADVPGFIVNHVARPYYLEAFRILEDRLATVEEIDCAMKSLGGFRMGPLELTDLIGQDVNAATTRSVWEQLGRPPLLRPSALQEQLVEKGQFGRKAGRGVYDYSNEKPTPSIEVSVIPNSFTPTLQRAIDAFLERASENGGGSPRERFVFARILIALIVQAIHARERGVASEADIDIALRYGTNYPMGPFEWAERIGWDCCTPLVNALNETVADNRFALPAAIPVAGGTGYRGSFAP